MFTLKNSILTLYGLGEERMYKVCICSYKSKPNTINKMNIAKEKGFSYVYII